MRTNNVNRKLKNVLRQAVPRSIWVFSELHLPRPLAAVQVTAMLHRLAADNAGPPLVFEVRAEHGQLTHHLIGTPAEHVTWVQRTLRDLLPGLELDGLTTPRQPVERAARVRIRSSVLSLNGDRADEASLSVLSAMDARLSENERLVLQIVLGRRHRPIHLPKDLPDPTQPWWQLLTVGQRPAAHQLREQIQARTSGHGFDTVIRIGASAETPERRHQLAMGVLGALSTTEGASTYLDLIPESPARLNDVSLPQRRPLTISTNELSALLGWPLGEHDLPGVAPLHPRPLRVPNSVNRTERLFALPGAAGPQDKVGIAARDLTGHMIITGPTGSGKSTIFENLIAQDAAAGRALLVIDPKRQLVDSCLNNCIPVERIDDVVVIDPAEATTGRVVGFNPLDIGNRDPDVVVDGLVAVLSTVFHDGWGPRTEDIIHSGLLTLARVGAMRPEPFTLLDLPRLLTDDKFRSSVIGPVMNDPGLGSFWAWYLAQSPGAQAHAIAAPLNKLRKYLLRPSLRAILGQPKPAFRLRELFRENKIVLVPLNEALVGPIVGQLLGSLIVAETWMATLERGSEKDPASRPASVFIDEVQQYLNLAVSIDDSLSRSRSYGVGWHLAHQHRSQLPASTRSGVDSNAKSKLVFRPLDPDDATAYAKQAPELKPIDFLSLRQWEAYANLNSGGAPSGWSLIRTLPPPEPTGLGELIRNRSRDRYATTVPDLSTQPDSHAPETSATGAKRRQT